MLKNAVRETTEVLSVTGESMIVNTGIIAIDERTHDVGFQITCHTVTYRDVDAI